MSLDFVSITKVSVIGRYPNHVNFTMAVRDTKLKICPVLIVDLKFFCFKFEYFKLPKGESFTFT